MKIAQRRYSGFHLTRCIMAAGESYFIPAAENDISIGVWCVKGGTEHHPSVPAPAVHLPQAGDMLLLNDDEDAWSNDAVGHHDLTLYAPVDTEWVCIGENGHGRHDLSWMVSRGDAELPAETGAVVISGSPVIDGIQAGPDAYFRPRDHAVSLSGGCELILVRPAV